MSREDRSLVTIIQEQAGTEGNVSVTSLPLPDPTTYTAATTTITDGGTSVSGHLLSSTVRDDVVQISLSWNYLDASTWSEITKLFKDNYINTVYYYDQVQGDWCEREMYISDRNAGLWRRDEQGEVLGWTGCSLQLTEV